MKKTRSPQFAKISLVAIAAIVLAVCRWGEPKVIVYFLLCFALGVYFDDIFRFFLKRWD